MDSKDKVEELVRRIEHKLYGEEVEVIITEEELKALIELTEME